MRKTNFYIKSKNHKMKQALRWPEWILCFLYCYLSVLTSKCSNCWILSFKYRYKINQLRRLQSDKFLYFLSNDFTVYLALLYEHYVNSILARITDYSRTIRPRTTKTLSPHFLDRVTGPVGPRLLKSACCCNYVIIILVKIT